MGKPKKKRADRLMTKGQSNENHCSGECGEDGGNLCPECADWGELRREEARQRKDLDDSSNR